MSWSELPVIEPDCADWEDYFERYQKEALKLLNQFYLVEAKMVTCRAAADNRYDKEIQDRWRTNPRVVWPVIKKARLRRIWKDFGKTNVVRDVKGLQAIAEQMLDGIPRLRFTTEVGGHSQREPRDVLGELTDREWSEESIDKLGDFFTDHEGQWILSDYGLPQLDRLYASIRRPENDERLILWIDQALSVVHQRSDLAGLFVEGGSKTIIDLQLQGSV